MLRVIRSHTLEAILQVMRVAVNYRRGQKQSKKIALHLKSTLATPPIYDQAYLEKLATASPSNPVGITKPSLLLLFLQLDKKSLEEASKSYGNLFFDNFIGDKSMKKVLIESKLASKPAVVHTA